MFEELSILLKIKKKRKEKKREEERRRASHQSFASAHCTALPLFISVFYSQVKLLVSVHQLFIWNLHPADKRKEKQMGAGGEWN